MNTIYLFNNKDFFEDLVEKLIPLSKDKKLLNLLFNNYQKSNNTYEIENIVKNILSDFNFNIKGCFIAPQENIFVILEFSSDFTVFEVDISIQLNEVCINYIIYENLKANCIVMAQKNEEIQLTIIDENNLIEENFIFFKENDQYSMDWSSKEHVYGINIKEFKIEKDLTLIHDMQEIVKLLYLFLEKKELNIWYKEFFEWLFSGNNFTNDFKNWFLLNYDISIVLNKSPLSFYKS